MDVDEGTHKVVEEVQAEAAKGGERAMPEADVEATAADVNTTDDAAAAASEYRQGCLPVAEDVV